MNRITLVFFQILTATSLVVACPIGCEYCNTVLECFRCKPGFALITEQNSCLKCRVPNCRVCDSSQVCLSCVGALALNKGECVYVNTSSNTALRWFLMILILVGILAFFAFIWNFNKIRIFCANICVWGSKNKVAAVTNGSNKPNDSVLHLKDEERANSPAVVSLLRQKSKPKISKPLLRIVMDSSANQENGQKKNQESLFTDEKFKNERQEQQKSTPEPITKPITYPEQPTPSQGKNKGLLPGTNTPNQRTEEPKVPKTEEMAPIPQTTIMQQTVTKPIEVVVSKPRTEVAKCCGGPCLALMTLEIQRVEFVPKKLAITPKKPVPTITISKHMDQNSKKTKEEGTDGFKLVKRTSFKDDGEEVAEFEMTEKKVSKRKQVELEDNENDERADEEMAGQYTDQLFSRVSQVDLEGFE